MKKSLKNIPTSFDPNGFADVNNTIFGLPFTASDAYVHILPVPWDVTTSYGDGTSLAPQDIFYASFQVDLYDPFYEHAWQRGYYFLPINKTIQKTNTLHRKLAKSFIKSLMQGKTPSRNKTLQQHLTKINAASDIMNNFVYEQTMKIMQQGKRSILLGGDHSTPFRHVDAITRVIGKEIGMLVVDAHLDMRVAYEYFTYSHASVMYNILENHSSVENISFVGIRDYCEQEKDYAKSLGKRVNIFYNADIKKRLFEGHTWKQVVKNIIASLPQQDIYISIDIDGLMPQFCPHTGTPVAGGLDVDMLFYLLQALTEKNKRIIGADLVEVGHNKNEWDANVGARVLYRLCNMIN